MDWAHTYDGCTKDMRQVVRPLPHIPFTRRLLLLTRQFIGPAVLVRNHCYTCRTPRTQAESPLPLTLSLDEVAKAQTQDAYPMSSVVSSIFQALLRDLVNDDNCQNTTGSVHKSQQQPGNTPKKIKRNLSEGLSSTSGMARRPSSCK